MAVSPAADTSGYNDLQAASAAVLAERRQHRAVPRSGRALGLRRAVRHAGLPHRLPVQPGPGPRLRYSAGSRPTTIRCPLRRSVAATSRTASHTCDDRLRSPSRPSSAPSGHQPAGRGQRSCPRATDGPVQRPDQDATASPCLLMVAIPSAVLIPLRPAADGPVDPPVVHSRGTASAASSGLRQLRRAEELQRPPQGLPPLLPGAHPQRHLAALVPAHRHAAGHVPRRPAGQEHPWHPLLPGRPVHAGRAVPGHHRVHLAAHLRPETGLLNNLLGTTRQDNLIAGWATRASTCSPCWSPPAGATSAT